MVSHFHGSAENPTYLPYLIYSSTSLLLTLTLPDPQPDQVDDIRPTKDTTL